MKIKSPIAFLLAKRIKNGFIAMLRKPSMFIYLIFLVGLMALTIFGGNASAQENNYNFRSINELFAGLNALLILIFFLTAKSGFSTGGSIFSMPDVNFLFTGPIRPRKILYYGLLVQIKTALLMGFFILFQYGWMRGVYDIKYPGLLLIVLGYAMTVYAAQVTAMAIYSGTSSNDKLKNAVKVIFFAPLIVFIIWTFISVAMNSSNMAPVLVNCLYNIGKFFPITGWVTSFVSGILEQNWLQGGLGLLAWAALIWFEVRLIGKRNTDYYEDVLQTTENAYTAILSRKEGQLAENAPKNVKVGKTGITAGKGATVFYYKHLIENRRSRSFNLMSSADLIFLFVVLGFAFFMRNMSGSLYGILFFAAYMQVFSVSMGRLSRELSKPFVYLVPAKPFDKLFNCMRESFSPMLREAILLTVGLYFILKLTPWEAAAFVVQRFSFAILFISVNVVMQRLFSGMSAKGLLIMFLVLCVLVMAAPGVILGIVVSSITGLGISIFMVVLAVSNFLVSVLALFLCRNMLSVAELNN